LEFWSFDGLVVEGVGCKSGPFPFFFFQFYIREWAIAKAPRFLPLASFEAMNKARVVGGESLFEKLGGQYADGTPIESVPISMRRAKSIADHLHRMFNTRKGSVPHLPDYGLPDINEIYRKLPGSLKDLEETIIILTTKYEPRLERVRVRSVPTAPTEFKLNFEMSASIKGGDRILFKTSFSSTGESDVQAVGKSL